MRRAIAVELGRFQRQIGRFGGFKTVVKTIKLTVSSCVIHTETSMNRRLIRKTEICESKAASRERPRPLLFGLMDFCITQLQA